MILQITVFWHVTQCSVADSYQTAQHHITEDHNLHIHSYDYSIEVFFYPEDGGSWFLQNIGISPL
jgi:hypothetical protein